MKRILTLVVAVLAVSLYSCGKNDKKNDTPNPLIGEWALQSQEEAGKEFKVECQEYDYILFAEKEFESHEFKNDGNGCKGKHSGKTPYTVSNNQIKCMFKGKEVSLPFSVKDDILTITIGSVTQTYKKNARKVMP